MEAVMKILGFKETDTGPFVTALRAEIAKQAASNQTIPQLSGDAEERARFLLQIDWAMATAMKDYVKAA